MVCAIGLAAFAGTAAAQFDPPATYYQGITGTGSSLQSALRTRVSSPYTQRGYDAVRFDMGVTEATESNSSLILLAYTGTTVSGTWDSGVTWNREHGWPQSRGTSSEPARSDLHHLRAATPSANSSRGNSNFGIGGSFWDPNSLGGRDRGRIARAAFYVETRYTGLTVVNGNPGTSNTLGDRATLIDWHFQEPPDLWERKKNHTIYTSYQFNRNPFIDRPEWVWAIYGTATPGPPANPTPRITNNSRIWVGPATPEPTDGASTQTIALGDVVTSTTIPTQVVTLRKSGSNPTTFNVTGSSGVTVSAGSPAASVIGPFNAFTGGSQTRQLLVGVQTPVSVGNFTSTVTIDNTDVTEPPYTTPTATTGTGNADGNDVISITGRAVTRANSSLSNSLTFRTQTINFGTIAQNAASPVTTWRVWNRSTTPTTTASMDATGITATGATSAFSTGFSPQSVIVAGTSRAFDATVNTSVAPGTYSATYTILCADAAGTLGGGSLPSLTLTLNVTISPPVVVQCSPADIANTDGETTLVGGGPDGTIDNGDFTAFFAGFFADAADPIRVQADIANTDGETVREGAGPDGTIDNGDFTAFFNYFFQGCPLP
ncbi:MAG: endonuclease [Planctomyces sp.]